MNDKLYIAKLKKENALLKKIITKKIIVCDTVSQNDTVSQKSEGVWTKNFIR